MRHELAREAEACANIFRLEHGELAEDFFLTFACAQIFQHGLHGDTHAADRGLAVADGGVDGDAVLWHERNIARGGRFRNGRYAYGIASESSIGFILARPNSLPASAGRAPNAQQRRPSALILAQHFTHDLRDHSGKLMLR